MRLDWAMLFLELMLDPPLRPNEEAAGASSSPAEVEREIDALLSSHSAVPGECFLQLLAAQEPVPEAVYATS